MTCAYDKLYLAKAQESLGLMLDYAVHDLHYDIQDFFDMFIISGKADCFAKGDVSILAGRSGIELAYDIVAATKNVSVIIEPQFCICRRPEYWAGWALAYYQWCRSLSFAEINRCIPIKTIVQLYTPYHEMDVMHFVDKMDELYKMANPDTNLKRIRMQRGFSQNELAQLSEVPLRTLQQYEQRQKNINKAQVAYLIRLAKALYCKIEDLVEYTEEN